MRLSTGRNKQPPRAGGGTLVVVGVVLLTLCIHSSDAFIKAAIGLRIGYSPTEKGYGQPLQLNSLHSKNPAIKGQFLTGVHDTPPQGKSAGGVAASPAHGGARGGSGLLHHLKILGVNLYLGGPKPSHHEGGGGANHGHSNAGGPQLQFVGRPPANLGQGGGGPPPPPIFPPHGGQQGGTSPAERHRDLLRGQGPRGQYSSQVPQVGGGELRGIDEQNEIGGSGYSFPAGAGGGSAEVFQPAASQHPTYSHNLNVLYNPNGAFFTHATPPLLPHQQQHQHQPQQQQHQLSPPQNVQHQPPRPQHPPPRQGFSLASLMRGPQWTARPRLFRVPLMQLQFGRAHPPPPQMSGPMIPAQSSSSPRVQYSTLFSTNPTNAPPQQVLTVMPTSASSLPHFIHPAPQHDQQPPRPFSTYPYAPPPQIPMFPQQQQQQVPMGGGQSYASSSSNYFPTTLNSAPQNGNPFHHHQQQPHPQAQTMPNYEHHQNGVRPEFHHQTPSQDFYQQQPPPPPHNNNNNEYNDAYSGRPSGMPEDMRPPPGFEYSHTDSSPIVSMGMTSYDDPPVMMDDNNRDHKQREQVDAAPQRHNPQQQVNNNFESGLPEGMREISQDEYNAFLTAPTNIHTSHVSTQVMPPGPPSRTYDPFLQQQQGQKNTRRSGHLARSLLHWNSLLDKYPAGQQGGSNIKREVSRSYEMVDSDTQGTQASPTIAVPTQEKEKVPPKKRLGVHIRARRTTTTTTTTTAATPAKNMTPAQLTTN